MPAGEILMIKESYDPNEKHWTFWTTFNLVIYFRPNKDRNGNYMQV